MALLVILFALPMFFTQLDDKVTGCLGILVTLVGYVLQQHYNDRAIRFDALHNDRNFLNELLAISENEYKHSLYEPWNFDEDAWNNSREYALHNANRAMIVEVSEAIEKIFAAFRRYQHALSPKARNKISIQQSKINTLNENYNLDGGPQNASLDDFLNYHKSHYLMLRLAISEIFSAIYQAQNELSKALHHPEDH